MCEGLLVSRPSPPQDEMAELLANFNFGDNQTIMTIVLSLFGADLFTLLFLGW